MSNTSENTAAAAKLEPIDLISLLQSMYKRFLRVWWVPVVLAIVGAALGWFITWRSYSPMYTAESTFSVTAVANSALSGTEYNKRVAQQAGTLFPHLLTSDVLQHKVSEELGYSISGVAISASAVEDTNLITLTVRSSDPQRSYDVLQALMKHYPVVAEYVLGDVSLNEITGTGVPEHPDNTPNYVRRILIYALAGVGIFLLILIAYTMTVKTVRSEDDIKEILNVRVLGSIPKAYQSRKQKKAGKSLVIGSRSTDYSFTEAIRTVRSRLDRAAKEQGMNTLMVTSTIQGEGKTTLACNLALSLARRGYRVTLADFDLRKPSVAGNMELPAPEAGTIELLTNEKPLSEVRQQYGNENLYLVMGSEAADDVRQLLVRENLTRVLEELSRDMDYVILDTPPSAVVSDAAIISRYADGVIYVVRQDRARTNQIHEGVEMLNGRHTTFLGTILNAVDSSGSGGGYYYGKYGKYGYGKYGRYGKYGYGYGYGYGQSSTDDNGSEAEQAQ